jgi:hypothetical protein
MIRTTQTATVLIVGLRATVGIGVDLKGCLWHAAA